MTFKKEIRIPIKNSNLCVCMHNMTDVILQFEVFIAFIEGSFTLYHSCSKILVFDDSQYAVNHNMCNVMRFRSRDGYDISHGIKIERMHDSTKNELHDER